MNSVLLILKLSKLMGNLLSTRSNGDSSSELQANSLYRYPPKSGKLVFKKYN